MGGVTAFIYHNDYLKYFFGPYHPFKPIKIKHTLELLTELGVFDDKAKLYTPEPASEDELLLVHSKSYIEFVKKMCEIGSGYLDYGDTPARKGLYEGASYRVGGSIYGAKIIMQGEVSHAFNSGGGFHHAQEDNAAGFCVFNDIAVTVRFLQKKYGLRRIAIVDVDGHHGDGTQFIFYKEPILKISLHRYGGFFYPGTGNVDEIGEKEGEGYSVNIPLPAGVSDEAYLYAFKEIVPPLIRSYKPEIILNQFGVDGHYRDPLVGLALTTTSYKEVALTMHRLAHEVSGGRYLIVGGGGYDPLNSARCWAIVFITISEITPRNQKKYEELFDRVEPIKDERLFKRVMEVVDKLKKTIFPIHNVT